MARKNTTLTAVPDAPEAPEAATEAPAKPARKNLTAKVRNAITELADAGKTVAQIASECGVPAEKVEATLAAAAVGKTLAQAEAEGAVATDDTGAVTVAPAKPKKVSRVTREANHTSTGVRLFGYLAHEDGMIQDLGAWGANDFQGAVEAYEAANPEGRFALGYIGCPMRNVWHVASGE
jgi:hypothetical protein